MYLINDIPLKLNSKNTILNVSITSKLGIPERLDGMDLKGFSVRSDDLVYAMFANHTTVIDPRGWHNFFNSVASDLFVLGLDDIWTVGILDDDDENVFMCDDSFYKDVVVNVPDMFFDNMYSYYLPESVAAVLFKLIHGLRGIDESIAMEMFKQEYKENVITKESTRLRVQENEYEGYTTTIEFNNYNATVDGSCITFDNKEITSSWVLDATSYYHFLHASIEPLFKFTADPLRLVHNIDMSSDDSPGKEHAPFLTSILNLAGKVGQW